MDTFKTADQVEAEIGIIKTLMPQTYKAIQAKASEIGSLAYKQVRAGIRGQKNQFYAVEGGHVVGTPFANMPGLCAEAALLMVQYGASYLAMWGEVQTPAQPQEAAHGAN
jgi:hypothetical protein